MKTTNTWEKSNDVFLIDMSTWKANEFTMPDQSKVRLAGLKLKTNRNKHHDITSWEFDYNDNDYKVMNDIKAKFADRSQRIPS